jgi:hypothetical protein
VTAISVTSPTNTPRVAAPKAKAAVSSAGESGGVRKSDAMPMILAWIRDEEVFAKALLSIAIMIRPGATKTLNGTP